MTLSEMALRRPVATLMLYSALVMMGVFAIFNLPVDLMPNAGSGSLTVSVGIRGGLPPEDIESLVTKVVEEAVSTTGRLRTLLSVSRKDRSVTTLLFEPGTDMGFASLEVQERLAKIRNKLPKDIEKPIVARYDESDYPVVILAATSDRYTPEQLRDMVDNGLKPALMRLDGVANVEVGGGRERKILVEFNMWRLDALGLPIQRLINQLGANNLNLLTGKMDQRRDSYYVRAMGQYQTIDDIKKLNVALTKEGSRILLEDVAEVRDFYLEAQSHARLNRKPTVSVYIQKESQANTIRVARRIEDVVKRFQKEVLDPQVDLVVVSNQAVFIRDAIANVNAAIWQGALLCAVILWLFIRDIKHTLIVLVSIPLSVILTFSVMFGMNKALLALFGWRLDMGINIMTLFGVAMGIGMVVDNSIVVLENILEKKIHFWRSHPDALAPGRAEVQALVAQASREMTLPILASTLCTVIVFIPILFINKHVQILYTGLALTVTFSLVVSFFVAITVVPLLASWVPFEAPPALASALPLSRATARVPGWAARPAAGLWAALGAPVWRNRHRFYRRTMAAAVRRRYAVLLAVAGAFLVAGVIYSRFLEKDFMGSTEQDEFIIFVELPAGAKLEISDQVVADVEKVLSETPEIKDVVKTAAARVEGWSSKVYVTLVPQGERKRTVQEIIDELRPKVVDLGAVYDSFIYFSEPSSSKEFIIDVFGYDYEKLRDLAVGIAERLQKIKGLEDVKLRYKPGQPEIRVTIDKDRAALFGFTVSDIAETLHAQIRGLRATYFYTDSNQLETVARLQEQDRKTLEDVYNLTLISPEGELVPIKQVADFHYGLTPSEIWRKDKQRMIQVSANRSQMALGTAGKKTRAALAGLDVPQDYYYQLGGDYQQMLKNEREFRFAFVVMAILVFIVLACLFESYARPLLIMLTVPLAVISVVPVLLVTRTPVTMGVYLGFILLGGLVVTNAIILLDRLKAGPGINPVRTVMTAGRSRLRAIALVQLTTIVDLFPMIWDTSPSSPLWSPLAIAVVGGITGATVLTLFVVPACYLMIRDWERWKRRWAAGVSGETSSVGVTP